MLFGDAVDSLRLGVFKFNQVRDWGDGILLAVVAAMQPFFASIPKILGFIVILVIGWILAGIIARVVASLLRSIRFNELAERAGLATFVKRAGVETDSAGFLALLAKWFIRLIALVVAFDALGLPAVSDVLRQLLLWLPNLAVGIMVLVIGGLAANALAGLVRGATAQSELGNPNLLANITRVAVWAFAIVVAVNQIGIAETLVNTLFMAVVGSVAVAAGLAFGLGGQETAAKMVREWYERGRAAKPEIEQAAAAAARITSRRA